MKKKARNQMTFRQLSLFANAEECRKFEFVKSFYCRKSDSDMLRFLINQEAEKILSKNTATAVEA